MVLTDMMEEKYFKYVLQEDRGNFSEILPGVLDVSLINFAFVFLIFIM
jgi:hypothetical protein